MTDREPNNNNSQLSNIFERLSHNTENSNADSVLFKTLFTQIHTINLIIEPDNGLILAANNAACDFYGYTPEEFAGMHLDQINLLSGAEIKQELMVAEEGKRNHFYFRHKLKNGEIKDVEVYTGKIQWNGQTLLYSVIHDITEQEKAKKARIERLEFEKMITEIQSSFLATDFEDMDKAIINGQRRICNFLGTDRSSLWQGTTAEPQTLYLTHLCTLDEIPPVPEVTTTNDLFPWITEQLLRKEPVVIKDIHALPAEAKTDKESLMYYGDKSTLAIPFVMGEKNPIYGALAFAGTIKQQLWADLTIQSSHLIAQVFSSILTRKRNEQSLHAAYEAIENSEIRFKAISEQAMDGITLADLNGNYVYVNNAFCNMTGYTENELLKMKVGDLRPSKEQNFLFDETTPTGSVSVANMELLNKNGAVIYTDINRRKVSTPKEVLILGVVRDVTDRVKFENELIKAKEKAEESDRLKTAFIHNMSHEIRTPMNAIMGFSDLLSENYNNKPKLEKFSAIIKQRCGDLLNIINDLLDIAKIESGQLTVKYEPCKLGSLVAELELFYRELHKRTDKQKIKFHLQTLKELSDTVIITDKGKLKQILINLLSNAFKFTETGTIEGGCKLDDNHNLLFYVSDTGIGISPDKQQMIFERFAQIEQVPSRFAGGTGLGLSIVKGLVGLLGGELFLKSELGKGSTFSFTIPYKTDPSFAVDSDTKIGGLN